MKRRTIVGITLCVLIVSTVLLCVVASALDRQTEISKTGQNIKDTLDDALKAKIVAEIDGVPVSASKLEYRRLVNKYNREYFENLSIEYDPDDYPVDDKGILRQLAKEMFVLNAADAAGISYSDEEIMDMIHDEEAYIKSEIEKGNEAMIQRQERDEEFLQSLGMTREQFYDAVYIDMLRYSNMVVDYCEYYYSESGAFKDNITFESYIDEAYNKASINIVMKDTATND